MQFLHIRIVRLVRLVQVSLRSVNRLLSLGDRAKRKVNWLRQLAYVGRDLYKLWNCSSLREAPGKFARVIWLLQVVRLHLPPLSSLADLSFLPILCRVLLGLSLNEMHFTTCTSCTTRTSWLVHSLTPSRSFVRCDANGLTAKRAGSTEPAALIQVRGLTRASSIIRTSDLEQV